MKSIIAAVVALAATTQAFLLPPELLESNVFPSDHVANRDALVELPCPGCPVQVKDRHGNVHVKTNKPNHLSLFFKVEHKDGTDRLEVNGLQLYPNSNSLHSTFTAPQTIERHPHKNHDGNWVEKHHKDHKDHKGHKGPSHHEVLDPQLGYERTWIRRGDVISVDLQIVSVDQQFVNEIPGVTVTMVLGEEGQLIIRAISKNHIIDGSRPLASQPFQGKHCNRLCQWLTSIYRLGRPAGNCAKNKHGMRPGGAVVLPSHHKHRPGQVTSWPRRTWAQLVRNVASHILLPILIGVVAGVAASLIGMMVGTFIVMVWRTVLGRQSPRCRHRCRMGRRAKASNKEAAVDEEKAGLMDEQAPPPAYEEEIAQEEAQEPAEGDVKEDVPKA